ncbi:MAG TPA: LysM peptidoglycan-binding domain-containing protein [Anaerolineae bacterium]|nr:LysM peptidoglycan-binding domain-containing protein [Anaerolineae bacterium]
MTSTMYYRWVRAGLLFAGLLLLLCLPLLTAAQDDGQPLQVHVVQAGESAGGIAARYGISLAQLVEANNLRSLQLSPGTRLLIPAPPGLTGTVHLVRRRETLPLIAARYGVSVIDLMRANGLTRPDGLYVGQRLVIPAPAERPPMPTPPPIATPAACAAGCAQLSIGTPQRDSPVTSPVLVQGRGAAYEQTLAVRVLDATGYEIGKGSAMIDGPLGAIGPYSGVVTFTVPVSTQTGRIQVYSQSPADGAIEQLTSMTVMLQGTGLDEAVEQVKTALESQDYDTLARLMTDPWNLAFFRSESLTLSRDQALEQLRTNYLGPGQVFVDLSVDARQLLAGQISLAPDVTHVVFSSGWGADQSDDALLLFGTDASGQTRWGGMIYVFGALRPY